MKVIPVTYLMKVIPVTYLMKVIIIITIPVNIVWFDCGSDKLETFIWNDQ
jgi:hypothetical protein